MFCISDNCSKQNIAKVIKPFKKKLNIRFNKNKKKPWFCYECVKGIINGQGKFIWFLGDDDLVVNNSINYLLRLIKLNKNF